MSGLRLGCVPYLNARPLIHGLTAELEVPSILSRRFLKGDFDAALLPVYETLRQPAPRIVDGFGIGSVGAVHSVVVAHQFPLDQTAEIVLDPASRTSIHLLQILLSQKLKIRCRLVKESPDPQAARLLIGDNAIRFRESMNSSWQIFDLGSAWQDWKGLPFVFAVWTLAPCAPADTAELLRNAARAGLAARQSIAALESDPAAALEYLTHSIHYPIGEIERKGIGEFRKALIEERLLPADAGEPVYI